MQDDKVKAFLKFLSEDTDLQAKMAAVASAEEALALVNAHGFAFELEEFKQLMLAVSGSIKQAQGEELTDEELEAVAGGATAVSNTTTNATAATAATATSASASAI